MAETTNSKPKTARKTAAPSAQNITIGERTTGGTQTGSTQSAFSKVKEQASTIAADATDAARKAANTGKDRAAGAIGDIAKLAEEAAQSVEDRLGPQYANYARKAASSASSFAETLQSKDIDALLADTAAFVRRNPAVAIGTAAAVGFLLTRLAKVGAGASDDTSKT